MSLEGHFDRCRAEVVEGWVWDSSRPNIPLCVEVVADTGELLAMVIADKYRGDLYRAGKGNGAHGFSIPLSKNVFSAVSYLHIRVPEFNYELVGSPFAIGCREDGRRAHRDIEHGSLVEGSKAAVYAHLAKQYSQYVNSVGAAFDIQRRHVLGALAALQFNSGMVLSHPHPLQEASDEQMENIIVMPPIDWFYRTQRPQQLAREFAKRGARVFFLSPECFNEFYADDYQVYDEPCRGVFLLRLKCSLPHPEIDRTPISAAQLLQLKKSLRRFAEDHLRGEVTVVVQNPSWYPLASSLDAKIVYDCLDFFAGFEASGARMLNMERKLIRNADLVVTTSSALSEYVNEIRPESPSVIIRNGTSVNFFNVAPPPPLEGRAPNIGYVGAIEHWFDVDVIYALARMHRSWNFILAGNPSEEARQKLGKLENVKLLGEVRIEAVPSLLQTFDVGIIPFRQVEISRYTNPVKVYEYLAAGRGVVASQMEELDQFKEFVQQATSLTEFSRHISSELERANDRGMYQGRRLRVVEQTWASRAEAFLTAMRTVVR